MIVGEGGVEVPGFVATRNEVAQIVRYWATEILDLDFDFFLYGCTGSSEWRTRAFANRRLNTISEAVGKDLVEKAFKEAEQVFGKKVDPRAWKVFMEGTPEEQERFAQEIQERLNQDNEDLDREPGLRHSPQTLKRAYEMYEQGSTHFAVMNETGVDRQTAEWISARQLAGLGLPTKRPTSLSDADL